MKKPTVPENENSSRLDTAAVDSNETTAPEAIKVKEETFLQYPETPFVNEECGDTMWDAVLKENDLQSKSANKD